MATYDNGDLVRITGTFTNSAGTAVDPAAVYCQIMSPAGTITAYQYGVDVALVKSSTGVYYVDVDANAPGKWRYRFYATGTGQSADEGDFVVARSRFVS